MPATALLMLFILSEKKECFSPDEAGFGVDTSGEKKCRNKTPFLALQSLGQSLGLLSKKNLFEIKIDM